MKKILCKSLSQLRMLLLLVVMFVAGASAWAEQETINFAGSWSGTYVTVSGTNASDWGYDPALVVYQSYKGTFTAKSGYKITRMQFTMGSMGYGTPTVSEGSMTSSTVWENASGSTSIVVSANDMKMYSSVTITVESDGGSTPGGGDQGGGEDGDDVLSTFNFNGTNTYSGTATGTLTGGKNFYDGYVFTGSGSDAATMTINAPGMTSGDNCAGWSNGGDRLFIKPNMSFTIAAPEGFEMTQIAFATDANTMSFASKSGLSGSSRNYTWTGNSSAESFTMSANSWIKTIEVTLASIVEEGEITYTIDLVDAPAGAYVTLDGQTFDRDNTYTVEKSLGKSDLEAYEPEGYYAEVEYTRDSHTYTVTYYAYNYYDVTVTGTTDPNAGIVYNETTYHNGDRIESKDVLTDASVAAANVANSQGTVTLNGNAFTVNYVELTKVEISTYPLATSGNNGTPQTYTKSGVTVQGKSYGSYLNFWDSQNITVSSQFEIAKIELLQRANAQMTATIISGGGTFTPGTAGVWTATNSTKSVELKSGGDYDILTVNVWVVVPPTNYIIDLVNAPASAVVRVNDDQDFSADGTYTTKDILTTENIAVTCPDTHYYNVAYNAETSTFTVTFAAYNIYAVEVVGAVAGGVVYDGNDYTDEIKSEAPLQVGDVQPINVDGYDVEVTFDGTTFTVTYTAYPTVVIGANATDSEGNYWTSFSYKKPVSFAEGVTPCIVTGAENGVLTIQECEATTGEFTYDVDFTVDYGFNSFFDAMDGNLHVEGNRWDFNTGYGYAENFEINTDDWTTLTFTLSNDYDGIIKSLTFVNNMDRTSDWYDYGNGYGECSEIPVNGKTVTLGSYYGRSLKHVYLNIEATVTPVFPANTGILVKSDAANANVAYTVHEVGEENVDASENLLVAGCTTPSYGWNNANKLYYKLAWANDSYEKLGFYWGVEGGHSIVANPNKAYLVLDVAAAGSNFRAFTFDGDNDVTGIEAATVEDNAPVYNLQGQRVNATQAGVYVKNGRKFIVK